MTGRRRRHRRLPERGAAAVEFALILVPMLYLIFGGISYGYMFSFRQALSQAASEGSRAAVGAYNASDATCAVTGPFPSSAACPAQYAASQAVANSLSFYGKSCGQGNLVCTFTIGTTAVVTGCVAGHTCLKVDVSYPYRAHNLLPTVPGMGFTLPENLSFTSIIDLGVTP